MDYFKHAVAVVALVLVGLTTYAIFAITHRQTVTEQIGSPGGSTYNSAKVAEQVVITTSSTTLSIYNSDTSDRIITGSEIALRGAESTTTTTVIGCATSSSATNGLGGNTNYILEFILAASTANQFGTTTGAGMYIASSSPGITGTSTVAANPTQNLVNPFARRWASGSYLNCVVTTTTGSNTNLLDTNMAGYIAFPYRSQ